LKILVTGRNGLVGRALENLTMFKSDRQMIFTDRSYDLRDFKTVDHLIDFWKPNAIIHTAANVGGILANISHPVECFTDNIRMNTNVIECAIKHKVDKLIVFSSVCAYPDKLELLQEDKMHDGPPHEAHFGYAHAKRMVDVMVQSARKQHGSNFCTVTPVNMYGENDYYNLVNGHIIPSLTVKCFEAVKNNDVFKVWGDGTPKREFIYTKDVAALVMNLLERPTLPDRLIISNGVEVSIREIAEIIAEFFNYTGEIVYDSKYPNGQLRRPSDITRLKTIFPDLTWTPLRTGMYETLEWFKKTYPRVRQ
jgi:GDP-L-fucose synthase